jgi:hypothetical protein
MSASDPRRLIDEARQVLEGAMPGPWTTDREDGFDIMRSHAPYDALCQWSGQRLTGARIGWWDDSRNAAFIVWSRNHLPALCDALEQALAQVETLQAQVATAARWRREDDA